MQKYRKIKKLESKEFRRLMGVWPDIFRKIVEILLGDEAKRMSTKKKAT